VAKQKLRLFASNLPLKERSKQKLSFSIGDFLSGGGGNSPFPITCTKADWEAAAQKYGWGFVGGISTPICERCPSLAQEMGIVCPDYPGVFYGDEDEGGHFIGRMGDYPSPGKKKVDSNGGGLDWTPYGSYRLDESGEYKHPGWKKPAIGKPITPPKSCPPSAPAWRGICCAPESRWKWCFWDPKMPIPKNLLYDTEFRIKSRGHWTLDGKMDWAWWPGCEDLNKKYGTSGFKSCGHVCYDGVPWPKSLFPKGNPFGPPHPPDYYYKGSWPPLYFFEYCITGDCSIKKPYLISDVYYGFNFKDMGNGFYPSARYPWRLWHSFGYQACKGSI